MLHPVESRLKLRHALEQPAFLGRAVFGEVSALSTAGGLPELA